ncbi:TetR/AcrR family transcriptional regulator [Mycobacterium sp.]|uniref:TetR/AcrR family transcriptional regulator n=1 Tax=Mycobacterium sp. TaxID=1785 RepID=UPI003BAA23BE
MASSVQPTYWITGEDRRKLVLQRIYDSACEVAAERGLDQLDIDVIAQRTGCSRATVYRHAGGKNAIRGAVLARTAAQIVASVQEKITELTGGERIVATILFTLKAVRANTVSATVLAGAAHPTTNSSRCTTREWAAATAKLAGLDPECSFAGRWMVRVILSLLFWPMPTKDMEEQTVRSLVAPMLECRQPTNGIGSLPHTNGHA